MDIASFNVICASYDSTIKKNPVLTLDEEFYIFSKILQYRNKILKLICKHENVLEVLKDEARLCLQKNKPYKFFLIPVGKDQTILEEMKEDIAIFLEDSSIDMALSKYNIDFNVYEKALIYWNDHQTGIDSDLYVDTFKNLQNFYITKICNCNVKLLIKIATSFASVNDTSLSYDDLMNEAFFGLHRAVNLFDVSRGHKFSTYATTWIFSTVRRYIDNHGTTVHIPVNLAEQKRTVERIKNKFLNEHERNPNLEEIYELLKKKPENIYTIDNEYSFLSIGGIENVNEGEDKDIENLLRDEKNLSNEDAITVEEVRTFVRRLIKDIDEVNEKYIISNVFGFNKEETVLTKDEIISNLQITPREFDNIKNRTLDRLQKAIIRHEHLKQSLEIPTGWATFLASES